MGHIRLHVTLNCLAYSIETFIVDNIESCGMIATDSWRSNTILLTTSSLSMKKIKWDVEPTPKYYETEAL